MDEENTHAFGDDFAQSMQPAVTEVESEERDAILALPSGSALLIVRRGPNLGARFLLDSDRVLVGRHPDADIFLDDVTVSRNHAEFLRHGTSFQVRDLGSLNGIFFDGVRIDQALLDNGAEVQIGKYRMTFYASPVDLAGVS